MNPIRPSSMCRTVPCSLRSAGNPAAPSRQPAGWSCLEPLEPRQLLAAVAWDGGGDGASWHDPLNWSNDLLPAAVDDVTINVAGSPTITHSQGADTVNSLTTNEALVMSGGSLAAGAGFAVNGASLTYSAGTLGGEPVLTGGQLVMTGGASPITFIVHGTTTLSGTVAAGQTVWVQGNVANGIATLTVPTGNAANAGTILLETVSGTEASRLTVPTGFLTNLPGGVVRAGIGTGGTRAVSGNIRNEGNLEVMAGVGVVGLNLSDNVFEQAGGAFTVADGGSFRLSRGSFHVTGGEITTAGTGRMRFMTGAFVFTGGSVAGNAGVGGGGTLSVATSVTLPSTVVAAGSNSLVSNLSSVVTVWVRGHFQDGAATLTTLEGSVNAGTILLESASPNQASLLSAPTHVFTNQPGGILRAGLGMGGPRSITGNLRNEGSIEVMESVTVEGDNVGDVFAQAAGSLTVANGGLFRLDRGSFQVSGGTVAGVGTGRVEFTAGPIVFTGGSLSGEVAVFGGARISVAASVTLPSTLVAGGDSTLVENLSPFVTVWVRGITRAAILTVPPAGAVNAGTILLQDAGSGQDSALVAPNGLFVNLPGGLVRAGPGSGGHRTIEGYIRNEGSIEVMAGVRVDGDNFGGGAFEQAAGSFTVAPGGLYHLLGGPFNVTGGTITTEGTGMVRLLFAAFVFTGGSVTGDVALDEVSTLFVASSVTSASTVVIDSAGNTLIGNLSPTVTVWVRGATLNTRTGAVNAGTVLLQSAGNTRRSALQVASGATFVNAAGGTVRAGLGGGGTRDITGTFVNEGTLSVEAGVQLTVTGAHTQAGSGGLAVELASNTVFGRLSVSGVATLDGHVEVVLLNGFVPACFAGYEIVTAAGGVVGRFASVEGLVPGNFRQYITVEEANRVRLVVTSTADHNEDGALNSDDYVAFLDDYFAGTGDFNDDGVTNSDDFFAFLEAFFAGCP